MTDNRKGTPAPNRKGTAAPNRKGAPAPGTGTQSATGGGSAPSDAPTAQPRASLPTTSDEVTDATGDGMPTSLPAGGLVPQRGMFGVHGTGDTSGFGGLVRRRPVVPGTERPYGGWFDEMSDALAEAYPGFGDAVLRVVVDRGEITFHIRPEKIAEVCAVLRDDPALRFELCSSVSGVDYGPEPADRLHTVYHLTSMTYRRRIRLEVAVGTDDPRVPSVTSVYPTADWQERETYDMFGIVFTGHPGLTRIHMPDDWDGFPQRKDYPLGGVAVEYKGAQIPPPDTRRAYT